MCGIGGILRIVRPGEADYPTRADDPLSSPSGGWLWRGLDPRDLVYSRIDALSQDPGPKTQAPSFLIPESWLDALDDGITWRGPDGAGRFRDRVVRPDGTIVEVALVHRRLAIIDLESGAQPMVVTRCPRCAEKAAEGHRQQAAGIRRNAEESPRMPDARCLMPPLAAIAFNGCIYNHRELRAELEAMGHVFESDHSDTEVILHGWDEWGPHSYWQMDGMFAALIWDRQRSRLGAMCDGPGEKPLYTDVIRSQHRAWRVLASTAVSIESVRRLAGQKVVLVPERVRQWVRFGSGRHGCSPVDRCEGISLAGRQLNRLTPASRFPVDVDPGTVGGGHRTPLRGLVEIADARVRLAIERRLEADVPIGCLLSGGVDSSLITALACKHRSDLTAFTLQVPSTGFDETEHAARVCSHLGLRHEIGQPSTTAADDLCDLITTLGLPFGDSSILPTYWVCSLAARHVKVVLTGDGGDEIFAGYRRTLLTQLTRSEREVAVLLASIGNALPSRWRHERLHRLGVALRSVGIPEILRDHYGRGSRLSGSYLELLALFQAPEHRALFGADVMGEWSSYRIAWQDARNIEFDQYLPWDILRKTDTASMRCGIEARAPFLESGLHLQFKLRTAEELVPQRTSKAVLRELARKHLPREIVDRPKQGFAIPISDWWRTNFGGLRDLLLDMLAGDRPFGRVHDVLEINMGFVRRMLDEHWAAGGLTPMHTTRHVRPRDHGQRLFALVSLAIWARGLERRSPVAEGGS